MGHYVIMSHKQIERKICFTLLTLQESIKSLSLRKGQYDKPDGTEGKAFVSKQGNPCLVYWDLDANGWRMAVGDTTIK